MHIKYKIKNCLQKSVLPTFLSINLLATAGLSILVLDNKVEAGPPPPPPPPPPPKDINEELKNLFKSDAFFKKSEHHSNNQDAEAAAFLPTDPREQTKILTNMLAGDFYDAKLRLQVIKDVINNKKLSAEKRFTILKQINANGGTYRKDASGNIIVDTAGSGSTSTRIPISYTSIFKTDDKYKILYHTPTGVKEEDITSLVIEKAQGFARDTKNIYKDLTSAKLQQTEQALVYNLVKERTIDLIKNGNALGASYIEYYNNNIGDDSYKKYFSKFEVDTIKKAEGYKIAYDEKTRLVKEEIDRLDKSSLSHEELERKSEEIFEKYGESSWSTYEISIAGGKKFNYYEYKEFVINEAKKRAVTAKILADESKSLKNGRLKIIKADGTEEFIDNSEFNLLSVENNWDLSPVKIPLSQIISSDQKLLPETAAIKKLQEYIKILEENASNLPHDENIAAQIELTKRELAELTAQYGNPDNNSINSHNFANYFEHETSSDSIELLEILKDHPELIKIIKARPDLFPSMFNDPEVLAFLEDCSVEDYKAIIADLKNLPEQNTLHNSVDIESLTQQIEQIKAEQKTLSAEVSTANERISDSDAKIKSLYSLGTSVVNTIMNTLEDRLKFFLAPATGDEESEITKGVWISGLYGINKQGAYKGTTGYKGQTHGFTIGADADFNEGNDTIGMAYSYVISNFKYNQALGKTSVNGHVISFYGQKALPKNFSLQSVASIVYNHVKNKTNYGENNITGKFNNTSFAFQGLINYKYATTLGVNLIPNIGIKYSHAKDGAYSESNIGTQHLTIASKKSQLWTGIAGARVVFSALKPSDSISVIPGIHANIEHNFNNSKKKINAKITWKNHTIEKTIDLPKQPKLAYNVGANILVKKDNIDVLLEYNCHLQKKYQGHQGLVKLKINF